jgi:hypothetical protein
LLLLGLMLALSSPDLWSQTGATAQISGLISDPSGAVVPNARITATQTNTGVLRRTLSGPDGNCVLPNLPVGPYRFEVQASGFVTYARTRILLEVSNNIASSDSISVAGGQSSAASYRLDGATHMDNFSNINLPFPFPEAIQEFSVQTCSLTAQWELHPGAQVEVATKSGTSQFLGGRV